MKDKKETIVVYLGDASEEILKMADLPIYDDSVKECPECSNSGKNWTYPLDGYIVCSKCGLVLKPVISEEADWNNYKSSDGFTKNNSRCGSSTTNEINPFINPLSTFLPRGSKSVVKKDGKLIEQDISKLHIQHNYGHMHKSYSRVENMIENIATNNYSNNVIVTTKKLWADIMRAKKLTRGGVRKGLIACCLYYACIHHNCPRSPLEICKDFGLTDTRDFNKGDKEFKETFENNSTWSYLLTKNLETESYFSRLCSILEEKGIIREDSSYVLSKKCNELYKNLESELCDAPVAPKSIACGIIFRICEDAGIPVTKNRMAKTLGICPPTLSKTVKLIDSLFLRN